MKKEKSNIIKMQRRLQFHIGMIIFAIAVLYVLFHIFSYMTQKNITVYEVTEGTIYDDTSYQALAIRSESVVTAAASGNLYYFVSNLDSVGMRTNVYSIDTSGTVTEQLKQVATTDALSIASDDKEKLVRTISDYVYEYDDNAFQTIYSFKTNLASDVSGYYNSSKLEDLSDLISQEMTSGNFTYYTATEPGIVVFQTDGLEGLALDTVTMADFDEDATTITNLKAKDTVNEGEAVYKLITSDQWYLVVPIDSDMKNRLVEEEMDYVEIRFLEDNVSTWASASYQTIDDTECLILTLDDGVSRYATSRLLHISILFDEQSGLKIPNSAIVTKEFFTVPKEYFLNGNDSSDLGVLVKGDDGSTEFVAPTIYYETEDYNYIDAGEVSSGDVIIKPDSSDTYTIGSETATLQGVYNVNKGYAVFKQIEILYQNEDYAIIATGTSYGIANYDHIALDGDSIEENELIN